MGKVIEKVKLTSLFNSAKSFEVDAVVDTGATIKTKKEEMMYKCIKAVCYIIALCVMQFPTAAYGECDMIGILITDFQTVTDVDQLGSQFPGYFNEPSDFWDWFEDTLVSRNISGYAIIYYGLNTPPPAAQKVYEWPALNQHVPAGWNMYPDNQVFRDDDQDTETSSYAFWWAEQRIWNLDELDHNAHLILAHTRYASGGNEDIDDPHPFIWDYPWDGDDNPQGENTDETYTFSLEHNGTITDKQKLRDMTEELWTSWNPEQTWSEVYPYKTEDQGNDTLVDSEALFHWIVCNIKLAGNVEEGMRRALIAMKEWDCYKNFVFADAVRMYAYRGHGDLDPDGNHQLVYRVNETPSFFAVSSGKVNDDNLYNNTVPIPNHQMVEFDFRNWMNTYDNVDAPQYHGLPYSCDFDDSRNSTVNSSWYLNTHDDDNEYGSIRVVGNDPNRYLQISNTPGQVTNNEASMHVDLSDEDGVVLEFSYVPYLGDPSLVLGSPGLDEKLDPDGIYFSDDGGETFTHVYEMAGAYGVWQDEELDVDGICALHGLEHSSSFIVKFVLNDNDPVNNNRIGIDNISIYAENGHPVPISTATSILLAITLLACGIFLLNRRTKVHLTT